MKINTESWCSSGKVGYFQDAATEAMGMKPQSKLGSALESATNIGLGAAINLAGQYALFPLIGLGDVSHGKHITILAFFTVLSFTRLYVIRRIANWKAQRK